MKEVAISRLADISTVFNSSSDNIYYYNLLKNSKTHIMNDVELARPILRESNATIIWKSEYSESLSPFNELSEEAQSEISMRLKIFFEAFKVIINQFKNVSKNFANQLIEIPNKNSIFVNEDDNYVVIINWGFLEDSSSRKEGVIENLIAKGRSSILVKVENRKGNPIPGMKLRLESKLEREPSLTNEKGYARFGTLQTGEEFTIFEDSHLDERKLKDFICDNRQEYVIQIDKEAEISIVLKDQNGQPVIGDELSISTKELGKETFVTDEFGRVSFINSVVQDKFTIVDSFGKKIFEHEVPDEDTVYEIIIDKEVPPIIEKEKDEPDDFETSDDWQNKNIKFINFFGRNLKGLNVQFKDSDGRSYSRVTDNKGEINFQSLENPKLGYSFRRYNKLWVGDMELDRANYHTIRVKPILPWLWWILMLLLLALLICCLFFNCFCKTKDTSLPITQRTDRLVEEVDQSLPCDVNTESGGAGVTTNQHYLGRTGGRVEIRYDMAQIPDKLEVFYEGNLVATTANVQGNDNGHVGDKNRAGCCGTLILNYVPNNDDYCIIRVTGPNNTLWAYSIDCPR